MPAKKTKTAKKAVTVKKAKPAAKAKGVRFLRMEKGAAVYAVGSGFYQFNSALALTSASLN